MNFEDYETLPTQNFVTHMTAGAIAGVMEHCIMYPLDSVKTRMQSLRTAHNSSITETFRHMVKREGLLRPVRGMSAVVLGAGPAHAFYFATYEHCKHSLTHLSRHRHDHIVHGVSGCIASVVHDAVSNPAEVVKQRLQMANAAYRGVWECVRGVVRREGVRAFYRSYPTQLAMNVPFQALHFVTYEWATRWLNPARRYSPAAHAAAGALAGAVAAAATTPLDVCKTLLNTHEGGATTLSRAARAVWTHDRLAGFARGARARVLYQMPAAAICWLTYESFKHALLTVDVYSEEGSAPTSGPTGGATPPPAPPLACAALRLAAASTEVPAASLSHTRT